MSRAQSDKPPLAATASLQESFSWHSMPIPRTKRRLLNTGRYGSPMSLRPYFLGIFVLGILLTPALFASPAPQLTGTYKLTGNTDLGSEIRFTAELEFLNPADHAVTVSSVGLPSPFSPGHMVTVPATLTVQSHSKAQVSLQFVVPKRDFTAWSAGPHQLFLVRFQAAGTRPGIANVLLLRLT